MKSVIPERWKERVLEHIRQSGNDHYETLGAGHFRSDQAVHIRFPDGSYAFFRAAFYLEDTNLKEVAVFTEHCGYYFFPREGLNIETMRTIWPDNADE